MVLSWEGYFSIFNIKLEVPTQLMEKFLEIVKH